MTVDEIVEESDIKEILADFLEKENLQNAKIYIEGGTRIGDGYMSVTSAVEVKDGDRSLKLFVKAAPKDKTLREVLFSRGVFAKEIFFYTEVLPAYDSFLLEKTNEILDLTARCYVTRAEEPKEALVFENLKADGFVLFDKNDLLDEEHVLLVLRGYAKLHGVGYAFKDQRPELFGRLREGIIENVVELFENFDLQNVLVSSLQTLRNYSDGKITEDVLEKVSVVQGMYVFLQETIDYEDTHKIITQGDCWMNNILYKYKEDSKTPMKIKLVDFQINKLGLPVFDLSYFFYCSAATAENLSKLDYYLDYYHENLSEIVRKLGSDPEEVYPHGVFKEHWKKFCKFGLMMSLVITKIMLSEGDEIPNVVKNLDAGGSQKDIFHITLSNNEIFVDRFKDILSHFVDNKFI